MYTILLILLFVSAAAVVICAVWAIWDKYKAPPFPVAKEGDIRRATLKMPHRLTFVGGRSTQPERMPAGTQVLETMPGVWTSPNRESCVLVNSVEALWRKGLVDIDFVPASPPPQTTPAVTPPTPPVPPTPPPARTSLPPAVLVTMNLQLPDVSGVERRIDSGAILLQQPAAWEMAGPGSEVWTFLDTYIQEALRNGWVARINEHEAGVELIERRMQEIQDRLATSMQEMARRMTGALTPAARAMSDAMRRSGASLNEFQRALERSRRNPNPTWMSVTTTTLTESVPKKDPAPPKVDEPASALDQILADDE